MTSETIANTGVKDWYTGVGDSTAEKLTACNTSSMIYFTHYEPNLVGYKSIISTNWDARNCYAWIYPILGYQDYYSRMDLNQDLYISKIRIERVFSLTFKDILMKFQLITGVFLNSSTSVDLYYGGIFTNEDSTSVYYMLQRLTRVYDGAWTRTINYYSVTNSMCHYVTIDTFIACFIFKFSVTNEIESHVFKLNSQSSGLVKVTTGVTVGSTLKTIGFAAKKGYCAVQYHTNNKFYFIAIGNYTFDGGSGYMTSFTKRDISSTHTITRNMGPNAWMSPDSKWIFFPPKWITADMTYPKGLNSYYSGAEFVTSSVTTSIPDNTSYLNSSHTSAIRNALSNVYVQEIIFNKTSDKIIVLTNSVSGCFYPADGSAFDGDSHNPDRMFAFVYQSTISSWTNVSSQVDKVNLWSTYNETDGLYRPTISLYSTENDEYQYIISFGKPSYVLNTVVSYTNTIW